MQPRGCSDSKCTSLPELDWLLKILKETAAFSLQSWNACALFYFVHCAGSRVTVWFWCRTTFFLSLNEHITFLVCLVCFVLCTSGRMAVSMVTVLCTIFVYDVAVHCVYVSPVWLFFFYRCSFHIKTEGFVLKWVITVPFSYSSMQELAILDSFIIISSGFNPKSQLKHRLHEFGQHLDFPLNLECFVAGWVVRLHRLKVSNADVHHGIRHGERGQEQ